METNQANPQDFVYCLAASPNFEADGLLYAAKKSGLYRSKDGGQTWDDAYAALDLDSALPTTYVSILSGEITQTIYACVEGNILRSLNDGERWEAAELSIPPPVVTTLAASPNFTQDGILLAGTMQDGVFRSTQRGASWTGWNFGLYDPNINALAFSPNFADDQTVLAGTQSGIFRSTNGGRSWRDLDFPIDLAPVLALGLDQNGLIYAGTVGGLYLTPDAISWEQRLSDPVDQILLDNRQILILQESTLQYSRDSGKSWKTQTGFEVDAAISCLAAPLGLNPGAPLFAGFSDGKILPISI